MHFFIAHTFLRDKGKGGMKNIDFWVTLLKTRKHERQINATLFAKIFFENETKWRLKREVTSRSQNVLKGSNIV